MFIGGAVLGGTEHMAAGHVVGAVSHALAHIPVRGEQGEALIPQQAASAGESNDVGAAIAQPDPTDSPMLAASTGHRRPGSAGVWMVRPRAARTRTTGKSWMVKRLFPNQASGNHFPVSVWKRTLTATSARIRS